MMMGKLITGPDLAISYCLLHFIDYPATITTVYPQRSFLCIIWCSVPDSVAYKDNVYLQTRIAQHSEVTYDDL